MNNLEKMHDKNKILVPLNASLVDAMKVLRETGFRIVFIHDDDYKIVGVLTDGDIRSAIIDNGNTEAPVVDHMNKDFVFVHENTPKEKILKMLDTKILVIPVLDAEYKLVDFVDSGYLHFQGEIYSRAKAPARLSFSGGGTDFTKYFMTHGGVALSTTIDIYSHTLLKKRADSKIIIKSYDFDETVSSSSIDDLNYDGSLDLIKAGIRVMRPKYGFELSVNSDFTPGTGLGGSASILASVIGCFNEFREEKLDAYSIAELAYEAERVELQISGGWQDQYSTVFGGLNFIEFHEDYNTVTPMRVSDKIVSELEERMFLCYTGEKHLGGKIQDDIKKRNPKEDQNVEFIKNIKEITSSMRSCLLRGKLDEFGLLLHESWQQKKIHNNETTNCSLNELYNFALSSGAVGGRLVGTGGGGYFLFQAKPFKKLELTNALKEKGFGIRNFNITHKGLSSWTSRSA